MSIVRVGLQTLTSLVAASVAAGMTLSGCISSYSSRGGSGALLDDAGRVARTHVVAELQCGGTRLRMQSLGNHAYYAIGCGRFATYQCIARYEWVCTVQATGTRYDGDAVAPPTSVATAPTAPSPTRPSSPLRRWTDADVNEVVAQITPAITACAAAERRPVVLMLLFTTSGRAEAAQWLSDLTDAEHACVHAALERVDLPGDVDEPDSRILRFPSESSRVTVADAVPTTPSPPVSTEDAIRVALDARGDDIVACTDGRPTAVAVAWSAGALTITLRGRAHGSDVEGCVRAVCADLVAPPTGSGSVLHVVHASR